MTPFIDKAVSERKIGLALHYSFIHAAIVGMNAQRTFEFGAGGSTRVFVEALRETGGEHTSISTATQGSLVDTYGIVIPTRHWKKHYQGKSEESRQIEGEEFDIVLHDGSHAAEIVAGDIAWAWPRLKQYGLLLVHDTQHSYVGIEMRQGLAAGLKWIGADFSMTTLPYGFGLTVIRKETGGQVAVFPSIAKLGENTTELVRV